MATEVFNTDGFLKALSKLDGEAKWYIIKGKVFITDSSADSLSFPPNSHWNYAFSDELDCIDWERMNFISPV